MIDHVSINPLNKIDWDSVSKIYEEGIATGLATFETEVPNWESWNMKYLHNCRLVAKIGEEVVGFAVLSQVSKRDVYKGVAEVSLYVANRYKGQYIGEELLIKLIEQSEKNGFWTLQAGIFSENTISIHLHKKCGFRLVGVRKKIGQLNGKWHDVHLFERRSNFV